LIPRAFFIQPITAEGLIMEDVATIKVKKLHEDAVLPAKANSTDAGFDLVAIDDGEPAYDNSNNCLYIQYRTGISVEPPVGYHTEIFPRSSVTKSHLMLGNSIGLVDEGYRGEIMLRFRPTEDIRFGDFKGYSKGDRIGQLVVRKTEPAKFEWSDDLDESSRGEGGFGSTGA
jgi:dUTP pyrophosphatase